MSLVEVEVKAEAEAVDEEVVEVVAAALEVAELMQALKDSCNSIIAIATIIYYTIHYTPLSQFGEEHAVMSRE